VGGWAPWELILRVCHHWQIRHSINSQIGRKPWQGLLHRAPSKAEKEEPREMTQARARSAKTHCGSQKGKETNYVPKPSPGARSILKRRNET